MREGDLPQFHFLLPAVQQYAPELLVEGSGVGQEAGGKEDIAYKSEHGSMSNMPTNPCTVHDNQSMCST